MADSASSIADRLEQQRSRRAQTDAAGTDRINAAPRIVEAVERTVLDGLPRRPNLLALARLVGVSVPEIHDAFKLVRRRTIYSALLHLRLDAADRLLSSRPDLPPEAIALQCGFGHFGVFRRDYRLRFGRDFEPLG